MALIRTDSRPRRAGDDPVATLQFAGATCTIGRTISNRVRLCAVGAAIGVLLLAGAAFMFATWWLQVFAVVAIAGAFPAGVLILWPDTNIAFDAQKQSISICRRHLWADVQRTQTLPFSSVFSIGVTMRKDELDRPDSYVVELRLNGGRNIPLWTLANWPTADTDLNDLVRLTGLTREDRLA